jgi:hypothetical protein
MYTLIAAALLLGLIYAAFHFFPLWIAVIVTVILLSN